MMIEGAGGIRLRIDDNGANKEAVELVPEKGKEVETNRLFGIRMRCLRHGGN